MWLITMHPTASDNKQYHIACGEGDLAEYLLVPGNPDRVPKIAKVWDSSREVAYHREFRSFTGEYKGVPSLRCQLALVRLPWQ